MNYFAFDCKKQGFSHIKHNKECQDSSLSYFDDKIALAIVCDGHGGDDYVRSVVGSKFGCEIAKKNICNFVANVDKEKLKHNSDQFMLQLKNRIITYWKEAVYNHFKEHPFEESELAVLSEKARKRYLEEGRIESAYGTTLIAAVITPDYWFGIHIGDGKCVAIDKKGNFSQPVPWDEKCFLNSTTSICDTEALNNFRHFYSEERPVAVFVGSDGIDDCFKGDEQMYHFYTVILSSFVVSDVETAKAELLDYLPRLSEQGSGDDVSVAAVFDRDRVTDLKPVKEFVATHKQKPETGKDAENTEQGKEKPDNGSDNSGKNDAAKSNKELEEIFNKKIAEIHAALKEKADKEEQAEKDREELEKARQSEKEAKEQLEKAKEQLEKAEKAEEAKKAENAKLKAEIYEGKKKKNKFTMILIVAGSLFVVVFGMILVVGILNGKPESPEAKTTAVEEQKNPTASSESAETPESVKTSPKTSPDEQQEVAVEEPKPEEQPMHAATPNPAGKKTPNKKTPPAPNKKEKNEKQLKDEKQPKDKKQPKKEGEK